MGSLDEAEIETPKRNGDTRVLQGKKISFIRKHLKFLEISDKTFVQQKNNLDKSKKREEEEGKKEKKRENKDVQKSIKK